MTHFVNPDVRHGARRRPRATDPRPRYLAASPPRTPGEPRSRSTSTAWSTTRSPSTRCWPSRFRTTAASTTPTNRFFVELVNTLTAAERHVDRSRGPTRAPWTWRLQVHRRRRSPTLGRLLGPGLHGRRRRQPARPVPRRPGPRPDRTNAMVRPDPAHAETFGSDRPLAPLRRHAPPLRPAGELAPHGWRPRSPPPPTARVPTNYFYVIGNNAAPAPRRRRIPDPTHTALTRTRGHSHAPATSRHPPSATPATSPACTRRQYDPLHRPRRPPTRHARHPARLDRRVAGELLAAGPAARRPGRRRITGSACGGRRTRSPRSRPTTR